jgi:hypothetical protein
MAVEVEVVGSVYAGPGGAGDFGWMLRQPAWADALFVFNDNEEQFRAFQRGEPAGCARGGGNAAIRPHRCDDPPRAAGIPTGVAGAGYERLTSQVRAVLDDAFSIVEDLLATGRYRRVVYSAVEPDGLLGVAIYAPGADVRRHITDRLHALARPG